MAEDFAPMMGSRRSFLASAAAAMAAPATRPNILWLTCEDTGPQLGCYGDAYATTPSLDAFARTALRYDHAWSNAPVCAPARTTIISGLYPTSTGSEHMRSFTRLPADFQMFPCYLRQAGYYCTNNAKEDYNLDHTGKVWDESSGKAHYRNRKPGQPFFAVFNNLITHESQIRTRPHTFVHDPSRVRIPEYHPDAPEVRQDWAQYYDNITTMDQWFGRMLDELRAEGLDRDTVVFFYGDHGSGMPRSKRWPYNSGLRVPLLVHVPEKFRTLTAPGYRPGGATARRVSFVDLAPTVLSLAGVKPPSHMQGLAFLGRYMQPAPSAMHGFRGRMDERRDMVRSVTDGRYVYIRNYMPHRIYGQHVAYMFETPTTRVWQRQFEAGSLNTAQQAFWKPKPPEELYDLERDPDEVVNLVGNPDLRETLGRLRKAQQDHARRILDVGFLPEGEIHTRAGSHAPFRMARSDAYSFERVFSAAELASAEGVPVARLAELLSDPDSAVRYWAATGLLRKGQPESLLLAMRDASPYVRVLAAESAATPEALAILLQLADAKKNGVHVAMTALDAIDRLGARASSIKSEVAKLPKDDGQCHARFQGYIPRLIEHILRG